MKLPKWQASTSVISPSPRADASQAMDAEDRPVPTPESQTSRLLEQLMQIARISALEEMASGFAHELNQPIGAIATFAQAGERMLSRPEPMTAAASDVLRQISNQALNAGQGIRRIRKLFNDATVARSVCAVPDVLSELMPVLELLAGRGGVTLEMAIDEALPMVSVDRLRIQHVLYTLVQNSLEVARPPGQPAHVRIEVTGDRYAVITAVIDNGIGLSSDARGQLFRPFFTTKDHGTGLGLASSRAIVEAHEGTIGCNDVDGGGARFWFRLPATTS
jgi:C4-dicarboxylate-specific signal transduction histidine kinase